MYILELPISVVYIHIHIRQEITASKLSLLEAKLSPGSTWIIYGLSMVTPSTAHEFYLLFTVIKKVLQQFFSARKTVSRARLSVMPSLLQAIYNIYNLLQTNSCKSLVNETAADQ